MSYRLSSAARADLAGIWSYIYEESGSETVADRQLDTFSERFQLLVAYPNLGRARDQDLGVEHRSYIVGRYLVIYRQIASGILISRVLHSARDLHAVLTPDD